MHICTFRIVVCPFMCQSVITFACDYVQTVQMYFVCECVCVRVRARMYCSIPFAHKNCRPIKILFALKWLNSKCEPKDHKTDLVCVCMCRPCCTSSMWWTTSQRRNMWWFTSTRWPASTTTWTPTSSRTFTTLLMPSQSDILYFLLNLASNWYYVWLPMGEVRRWDKSQMRIIENSH